MSKNQNKKLTQKNKKRLIVSLVSTGILGLGTALTCGAVAATKASSNSSKANVINGVVPINSTVGDLKWNSSPIKSNYGGGLLPIDFNYFQYSENNNVSNLFVENKQLSMLKEQVFSYLNNLSFPWLSSNSNSDRLKIINYELNNSLTMTSRNIMFHAIELQNNNSTAFYLNYGNNQRKLIQPQDSIWVYCDNGMILVAKNFNDIPKLKQENKKSILATVDITNKSDYFTTTKKDGKITKYIQPLLPQTTPLQVANNILNKYGNTILPSDIYNLFNYLNCGKAINFNASVGSVTTDAAITFTNLKINWNGSSFTPATSSSPAIFTIGGITGDISIYISAMKQSLKMQIKNTNKLTFFVKPLVMWKNANGNVETSPSISSNTISGTTFNSIPNTNMPSNPKDLKFGYYLEAANSSSQLSLYTMNNQPFTLLPVAYSYIFYNFWMTKRIPLKNLDYQYISDNKNAIKTYNDPNDFGSVFQNGNVSLKGNSEIPNLWLNGTNNDGLLNFEQNINSEQNITLYKSFYSSMLSNIDDILKNNKYNNTLLIDEKNNKSLYDELIEKLNLNNTITVSSFTAKILKNETTNSFYIEVISMNVYNKNYESSPFVYYLKSTSGNIYPIYPIASKDYQTVVQLAVNIKFIGNKTNIKKIDVPKSFNYNNPEHFSASLAINNNSFNNYVNKQLLHYFNKKDFIISNLKYTETNDNKILIDSFDLTNLTPFITNTLNQNILPFQTINFKNLSLIINGFVTNINWKTTIDVSKSNCSNLLLNNFVYNDNYLNENLAHFESTCKAITLMQNDEMIMVDSYQANTSNEYFNSISLVINSLKITNINKKAVYFKLGSNPGIYLLPNQTITLKKNNLLILYNFKNKLSPSPNQIMNMYLDKCQDWLRTLTNSDIQQDFNIFNHVSSYSTAIPAATCLNYSNFHVNISNFNPNNLTAELSNLNWNINGYAITGVSVYPQAPIQVTLKQTKAVTFKLVPIVYYVYGGALNSYPEVNITPTNWKGFAAGIHKFVSVSTTLNYNDVPNPSLISNVRFGYYLEPTSSANQTSDTGSGLALPLTGPDAWAKPLLNLSYAFNGFCMERKYTNWSTPPSDYGSLSDTNSIKLNIKNSDVNPYGVISANLNSLYLQNINDYSRYDYDPNFISLYNYVNDPKYYSNILNSIINESGKTINGAYVSLNSVTLLGINDISSITVSNWSHITYKINQVVNGKVNSYFILPEQGKQVIDFAKPLQITNNVSRDAVMNLTWALFNGDVNEKTSTQAYLAATQESYGEHGYLYPLLFASSTSNQYYSWWNSSVSDQLQTIVKPQWHAYIDDLKQAKIDLKWIPEMIGYSNKITPYFQGYKIIYEHEGTGFVNILAIKINNLWINNIDITIQGGGWFPLY